MEHVLIVTPDADEAQAINNILQGGGHLCLSCNNKEQADEIFKDQQIPLCLVRLRTGNSIDRDLLKRLANGHTDSAMIAIVDGSDHDAIMHAGKTGVSDFIQTPLNGNELSIRVKMALAKRPKAVDEMRYRATLENIILAKTEEIWVNREKVRNQFIETINALLRALQARHVYTEGHSRRVAEKSVMLARALKLSPEEVRDIELAALFHDIGKLAIRDNVLNKAGKLTDSEYEHIKTHPLAAEQILSPIAEFVPVIHIIKHEHERWDGKGYPDGIAGETIPIGARIVQIADTWDSLIYDRIYRKGCTIHDAAEEIRKHAATQFDPRLVELYISLATPKTTTPQQENAAV